MDLTGHRALVIGAAGGIGQATCRAYAEAKAVVYAADIDADAAEKIAADLPNRGHRSEFVDVTDSSSIERLAETLWREGPVHSIVYSPGLHYSDPIADIDWNRYRRVMAVNLDGAFYTAQSFVKRMTQDKAPGSLTFISSIAGKRGGAGAAVYCASKFGLIGMVESVADELAELGIRVNAICPGNVDTPMLRALANEVAKKEGQTSETILKAFAAEAAARRLIAPEEVAALCLWLASSEASAITGASLVVDLGSLIGHR